MGLEDKSERMTIEEVSEVLGIPTRRIRLMIKRNQFDPPICRVVRGDKYDHYLFFRKLVDIYVGAQSV